MRGLETDRRVGRFRSDGRPLEECEGAQVDSEVDSWDDGRWDDALKQADLRVLLMCLYQVTGDGKWLEDPFIPARDVRLVADPLAGLGPEAQDAIREAAREVLATRPEPAIAVPDEETLQHMMSVCLGERVRPEYAPMM